MVKYESKPEPSGDYYSFEGKKILTLSGPFPGYKPGTLWLNEGLDSEICPLRQFGVNGSKPGTLPGQTTPDCQSTLG